MQCCRDRSVVWGWPLYRCPVFLLLVIYYPCQQYRRLVARAVKPRWSVLPL